MARTRTLWLTLLLLTAAGCEFLQDEPDPVAPTAPVVTVPRFADAPFVVPLNEPFTLTALVNQPDGSPATGYEFNWGGWLPGGPEVRAEVGHPSPGVETLTLTFLREGRYDISAIVTTVNGAGAAVVYVRPETVIAWGGTTRELLPFQQALALRVGEARPTVVLPHAQRPTEPNVRLWGHQPVTYSIEHPALARVDASGVVHGLAPGSTRLTFRTGSVTSSIPVTVTAGDLLPPPDGLTPYDGLAPAAVRPEYGAKLRAGKLSPEDQLALDSRGWPLSVLTAGVRTAPPTLSQTLHAVLLGAWTGSGVGLEQVNQPWDDADHPRLALDSRDVPYVAYLSRAFNDVVIADRPARGAPDSWRHRRLPMDLSLAAEGGLRPRQYVGRDPDGRITLLPRPGGGVWVAYWMVDDFRTQNSAHHVTKFLETPGPCADVLKLAEVTDAQVKTWEVSVEWYRVADGQDCGRSTGSTRHDDRAPHLLPPAPGASLPRIVSTLLDNVVLFEPTGDTWSSRELARPGPGSNGYVPPNFVTLARPESPEGRTVLLSYSALKGALPPDLSFNALPGQPALPYLAYEGGDSTRQTLRFAFQSAGRLFSGSGFVGPLVVQTGLGAIRMDDPSGTWTSPRLWNGQENADFPIRGQAHRGTRLHLLSESSIATPLLLSRALPQADPLPTDAESQGSRLGAAPSTPGVSSAPLVLADGTRYLLTDFRDALAPGGVLRSAGPGQPFVTQSARPSSAPLSLARQLHASRDGLFFFTEPAGTPRMLELHRSTDQGRAFSRVSTLPVTAPLEAGLVHPDGPVFLLLFDSARPLNFQLGFSPDATSSTPPVLRAGFSSADEGKLLVIHGVLLPAPNRVWLVLDTVLNDGTTSRARVLLREYDLSGTLVSERTVDPLLPLGHYLRPPGAALSGDGALLWMTATEARRFDLATGNLARAPLPAKNVQELVLAPVRLTDDRWLLPVTDSPVPHVHRAGYRLSPDGLNWGPFKALRPGGGDAQSVLSVAAEPGGAALFVLQDSHLMMASDGAVTPQALVQREVP